MFLARLLCPFDASIKQGSVRCRFLLLLCLPVTLLGQTQDWHKQLEASDATLGTVRRIFQGKSVVVIGPVVNLNGSVLLEWMMAEKDGERYVESNHALDHLPSTYKGRVATVIVVQLNNLNRRTQTTNALGETVSDDAMVKPYFDLVVRFDDGVLAMTTGYPITISGQIELASAVSAISEEMARELPLIVGKTLYAVGFSRLYQPDTTLEDLSGTRNIL